MELRGHFFFFCYFLCVIMFKFIWNSTRALLILKPIKERVQEGSLWRKSIKPGLHSHTPVTGCFCRKKKKKMAVPLCARSCPYKRGWTFVISFFNKIKLCPGCLLSTLDCKSCTATQSPKEFFWRHFRFHLSPSLERGVVMSHPPGESLFVSMETMLFPSPLLEHCSLKKRGKIFSWGFENECVALYWVS